MVPSKPGSTPKLFMINKKEMGQVRQMMSLGMVLPRGDTTQRLINGAQQTGIDFRIGHDQSKRRWVRSSTRGSWSTVLRCKTLWPQGCSSISSPPPPHLPKDNQEVTAHMKRLQAMLDVATVADPALNHDDEARGHDRDHG
jgi:hypothetical protein